MTIKEKYERIYKPAYREFMRTYPFTIESLEGEIWREVEGYPNYQVSTFGRVKSFARSEPRILKPRLRASGYLFVQFGKNGESTSIHRLVAQAFIPNPKNKPEVDHINTNTFDCRLENLRWATVSENAKYAVDLGLIKTGEDAYQSKFTNEQIVYTRDNPDKLTGVVLAEMFGVNPKTISTIQLGRTYKNTGGTIRNAQKKSSRVPDEQREQIRFEYAAGGTSLNKLAAKFGVSKKTVLRIIHEQ